MSVVLSEYLPLLATAPNGIQKLRGLILELAVRGKLVTQDPDDDQNNWKRGLFSDFFSLEYGDNLPAPKRTGTGEYPVYGSNGVVGTHNECRVKDPCVVVGRKGSAGALNLCREPGCWVTDVAYYCIPPSSIDLDFVVVLFHTLGLDNLGKGIKPGLSRNEAYSLPVAIPPLAEQHRIVAKVDQLMALCNLLEAEQADSAGAHARLVETLLGTLTQSADAADLTANWQRLAEHFDTLFTTESSLEALKQTILQLAVMGKLVPQDPNDEPANELLKRIEKARTRLEAEGACKKSKAVLSVGEDGQPFALPQSWVWVAFSATWESSFYGPRFGTEEYVSVSGVPTIRTTDMQDGVVVMKNPPRVSVSADKLSLYQLKRGDLLVTRSGSIGTLALYESDEPAIPSAYLIRLRLMTGQLPQYAKLFLSAPLGQGLLGLNTTSVGVPNVNASKMAEFPFPLPPPRRTTTHHCQS